MPLITALLFSVFIGLLFLLSSVLKNRKQLGKALIYGQKNFKIDLPIEASIDKSKSGSDFPHFAQCSDAEGFYQLVTPYLGSLSKKKREELHKKIESLKEDLKMNKNIYRYFTDEYDVYKNLSDKNAATKWSGKEVKDD